MQHRPPIVSDVRCRLHKTGPSEKTAGTRVWIQDGRQSQNASAMIDLSWKQTSGCALLSCEECSECRGSLPRPSNSQWVYGRCRSSTYDDADKQRPDNHTQSHIDSVREKAK